MDATDVPPVSLDDFIDDVIELLAEPDPETDVMHAHAELGIALIERAQRDDTVADLSSAIEHLTEAFETEPGHEDSDRWAFFAGIAYGSRFMVQDDIHDIERSIDFLEVAHAFATGPSRAAASHAFLAQALWRRYRSQTRRTPVDNQTADQMLDDMIAEMDGWLHEPAGDATDAADATDLNVIDMVRGIAHLDRYDRRSWPADLDAGIALVAATVWRVDDGGGWMEYAATELISAYRSRAELREDPASLDAAITHGRQLLDTIDADAVAWEPANGYISQAYGDRWSITENPADLDGAIEHARAMLACSDGGIEGLLGDWLRERAALTRSTDDVHEGIRLMHHALREVVGTDSEFIVHYDLGKARRLQFQLTGERPVLDEALRCLDRAVALVPVDEHDLRFLMHLERLTVGHDTVSDDVVTDRAAIVAAAPAQRAAIEAAHTVLVGPRPTDAYVRPGLAGVLALTELSVFSVDFLDVDLDRLDRTIGIARDMPDADADWRAVIALAEALVEHWRYVHAGRAGGDAGITTLRQVLSGESFVTPAIADQLRAALALLVRLRAIWGQDLRVTRRGRPRGAAAVPGHDLPGGSDGDEWVPILDLVDALQLRDWTQLPEISERLEPFLRGNDGPVAVVARTLLNAARTSAGLPVDDVALPVDQPSVDGASPSRYTDDMMMFAKAAAILTRQNAAAARNDLGTVRRLAWELDAIATQVPEGRGVMRACTGLAAVGLADLCRLDPTDHDAFHAAVHRYQEVLTMLGGPESGLWAEMALGLGECLRLRVTDYAQESREHGISAITAHTFRVFLQTAADYALESAARVAGDVYRVARWCVLDGALDDLVAVLDAGRGVALRAATLSRDIAVTLTAMGEPDLAREWEDTRGRGSDALTGQVLSPFGDAAELPNDLRRRVLHALGAEAYVTPTTIAEIRDALATSGSDALVYLVPGSAPEGGYAVVVPTVGDVRILPLQHLDIDEQTVAGRYASAGATRDAESISSPSTAPSMDELCQWAWRAAVADILRCVRGWQLGRPARLVLVPMGPLALVPWHAAYTLTDENRRSYALTEVVFSYGVSARLFCDTARRAPAESGAVLVIGNPTGDLEFAGVEARAIHERFYDSTGVYFGQPADVATAAGSPHEVLDWITGAAGGPSTLHFACHGRIDPTDPTGAHLVLAGGATLTARDLLDACSLARLEIDRMFLAACTTNTVGADYDEAFSLAGVFLSAGALTVYGSLWPVPDADTSLLMYMLHHLLNVAGLAPVDALHDAQLWMLDPDREPPPGMPENLRVYARRAQASDPIAWAGFTHMGR